LEDSHEFPKSVVVIGASRGIGAAIATKFIQEGHKVVGTHRGSGVPDRVRGVVADITDTGQIENALAIAAKEHGPIDILAVSSGITRDDLLMRMSEEKIREVMDTNAIAPMLAVKSVLKPMLRAKAGSIVLVSSISARLGVAGQANYTASKAALEGFARSFAREYASRGIRINIVAPGPTDTDMIAGLNDDQRQVMAAGVPLGRLGKVEEIADVVYWVSQSTFMTGTTVPVAGGLELGY
jgi:NAD(P)-dependent dehydrogenase (short-subunit alcohol dehydrogenase family)